MKRPQAVYRPCPECGAALPDRYSWCDQCGYDPMLGGYRLLTPWQVMAAMVAAVVVIAALWLWLGQ